MMNFNFKTESRTIKVQNTFFGGKTYQFVYVGKITLFLPCKRNFNFFYVVLVSEGSCDTEDWSKDWYKLSFAITGI